MAEHPQLSGIICLNRCHRPLLRASLDPGALVCACVRSSGRQSDKGPSSSTDAPPPDPPPPKKPRADPAQVLQNFKAKMGLDRSLIDCPYFMGGTCASGTHCRFKHAEDPSLIECKLPPAFQAKEGCGRKTCPYYHTSELGPRMAAMECAPEEAGNDIR